MWSYIGWRANAGARPYADLWESKPPGIYAVFAACSRIGGTGSDRAAFWLDAVLSTVVLVACYRLARRFCNPIPAAAATLLASLVLCHRVLADWGDNVEKFVAMFEAAALLSLAGGVMNSRCWLRAGVCIGLGGLFKQTAIVLPAAAIVTVAFRAMREPASRRSTVRAVVLLAVGAAIPWLIALAWMTRIGIASDFWRLAVLYDLRRVGGAAGESLRVLSSAHWLDVGRQLWLAAALFAPAIFGAASITAAPRRSESSTDRAPIRAILAVELALGLLLFAIAPYGYGHYLLQFVPAATALAATTFAGLARQPTAPRGSVGLARIGVIAVLIGACALGDHAGFTLDRHNRYRCAYVEQGRTYDALVACVRERSGPDDAVLVWPPDYALSYYAARRTPLEGSNADVLFKGKHYRLDPAFEAIVERIRREPPRLIIDRTPLRIIRDPDTHEPSIAVPATGTSLLAEPNPRYPYAEGRLVAPLQSWVRAHYGPVAHCGDAIVFELGRPWREATEIVSDLLPSARP